MVKKIGIVALKQKYKFFIRNLLSVVKNIIQEIAFVVDNFNLSRKVDYIRAGYRMTKVKSHLIFLRKTDDFIEIIRILHENMDVENRLLGDK